MHSKYLDYLSVRLWIVVFFLVVVNLTAFKSAEYFEQEYIQEDTLNQLQAITYTIEDNLRENSLALKRMAKRWNTENKISEKVWREDALNYSKDLIGIIGVGYADRSSVIQWIEPKLENAPAIGFKLNSEERRKYAIDKSELSGEPQMTGAISLRQRGLGYLVIVPAYKGQQVDGYIYLIGRFENYLSKLLRNKEYLFSVTSDDELVFSSDTNIPDNSKKFKATSKEPIAYTKNWKISVYPRAEAMARHQGTITFWALIGSLFFSILLVICVWFLEKSKKLTKLNEEQNIWKKSILDSTEIVVISTDTNGVVATFNKAAERLLGYSASEVIGLCTPELWHVSEEILERAQMINEEFNTQIEPGFNVFIYRAKKGISEKNIWTVKTKLGTIKKVSISVHTLKDETLKIFGYVGIVEEITDTYDLKNQLKDKEAMIISLLESTFDGYWERDFTKDYQYFSPRYWQMLGYDPLEKKHHPSELQSVMSPEGYALESQNLKKHIETRGQFPFEQTVRFIHKDGHDVWVLSKGKITEWTKDGSPSRMVGTHTDVTELVLKEQQLEATQREIKAKDAKILEMKSKSDDWFRVITDSLPQLMWTCLAEGPCDYLSDQWVKYTGIPEEQQLGFEWLKQLHPDDKDRVIAEWKNNIIQGTAFTTRFRIRRYDGVYHWFDTMAIPIKDNNGKIVRWLGSNTDIQEIHSANERLEEIKTRLEVALEGSNIGVWEWDINTQQIIWDDQMFKMYEQDKTTFSNTYEAWAEKLLPDDRIRIETDVRQAFEQLKPFNSEFRIKKKNGEIGHMIGRARVITDTAGRPLKMVGINWDISQIKLNELALEKAKVEAMQSSIAKAQFLANMSHEIRTPLNGIIGMSDLLKDTPLNNQQKEYLEQISQSSTILLTLINDILDLSKIESGKIDLENIDFNLGQTIEFVLSSLSYSAKSKSISLTSELHSTSAVWLKGDPSRIKQVLFNLISNAIKFTEAGSVYVSCRVTEQHRQSIKFRFEVIDSGIGISQEQQKKLFQNFSQADASTHRKFGGTGLGLAISKRLIDKMHGSIGVNSELGVGSTFWIELELPVGQESESENREQLPENLIEEKKSIKILLAEDNLVNQKVSLAILKKLGYQCQVASNGFEVLNMLSKSKFNLILMDCQMPEMDGFEATERIRRSPDPQTKNVKIIAMTANAMTGDRERCLKSGMNDYISKPFSATLLSSLIEKWTKSAES